MITDFRCPITDTSAERCDKINSKADAAKAILNAEAVGAKEFRKTFRLAVAASAFGCLLHGQTLILLF